MTESPRMAISAPQDRFADRLTIEESVPVRVAPQDADACELELKVPEHVAPADSEQASAPIGEAVPAREHDAASPAATGASPASEPAMLADITNSTSM